MLTLVESTQRSGYSTWLEIRLDRLASNLAAIRARCGEDKQIMAVVKANAYGHGLVRIARALANEAAYLGVSSVAEALELKEHGLKTPIFLFGRLFPSEIRAVLADGMTLSVSSFEEAKEISGFSESAGRKTPLHVKVDTGMGRLGIPLREALSQIKKIAALPGIFAEGIYTHFPAAEREDGFAQDQLRHFLYLIQNLEEDGIRFPFRHAANSAAAIKLPSPKLNLLRPGLMLYGLYPDDSLRGQIKIAPILAWKSRIILAKRLAAGESSGYGRDFIAAAPTTIGVLPVGYSQGYPFAASHRAHVLYRGRHYPLAGRVSMDYLCVDFGQTQINAGDEVTLLGEDKTESIGVGDLAKGSGTIPYEIVTRLNSRLPRIYLNAAGQTPSVLPRTHDQEAAEFKASSAHSLPE